MTKAGAWRLALFGAVVYLMIAVATVPADIALGLVLPDDISAQSVRGTVWTGEADFVRTDFVVIPRLKWRLHPLALVTGKAAATIDAELPEGRIQGRVGRSVFDQTFTGSDVRGVLPLGLFRAALPLGGVQGKLWTRLERIEIKDGWPSELRGQATLDGLRLTVPVAVELGSFELELGRRDDGTLVGEFRDAEAAVETNGAIIVVPGQYRLEGRARAAGPGTLAESLKFLGSPDAEGFYPLNYEGSF